MKIVYEIDLDQSMVTRTVDGKATVHRLRNVSFDRPASEGAGSEGFALREPGDVMHARIAYEVAEAGSGEPKPE